MTLVDLFDPVSLNSLYLLYGPFIDGLVYLIFFTGLVHVTLGRRFQGRPGAAVSGVLGLALAIGASVGASRAGFTLGEFGPLAWIILVVVLALVLYELARALGCGTGMSAFIAFLGLTLGLASVDARSLIGEPAATLVRLTSGFLIVGLTVVMALALGRWLVHRRSPRPMNRRPDGTDPPLNGSPPSPSPVPPSHPGGVPLPDEIAEVERAAVHNDHRMAKMLLDAITTTPRAISERYQASITDLARHGLVAGENLDEVTLNVVLAARDNIASFDELVKQAQRAFEAGHHMLFKQLVHRLLQLEEQSETIMRVLDQAVQCAVRQAHQSGEDGAPRGRS